ncbi:hypothetical protein ONZ45_g15721 [Pleurotus djamor]|nr:hypothetical protein ONZ45_g15721 [Pleurotus djamor]
MLARVSKKKGRGRTKKLEWQYSVRWKGYGPDEDTWEPAASFEESEQFIDNFWKQAKTGGRDYNDLSLFTVGEEFFPIGPPPRKRKRASTGGTSKPPASPNKRRQIDREDSPPDTHPPLDPTTPQETDEPVSSRINRHQSSEVPGTPQPPLSDDIAESSPRLHDTCSTDEISRPETSPPVTPEPVRTAPPRRKGPPAIPEHRSRASKPLVKMVDDPQLSQLKNAIPAKARAAARGSTTESPSSSTKTPRISGSRAGPGRSSRGLRTPSSSLLTFKDGSLQSVKRQKNGESSRAPASQEPPPFAAIATDWAVEESFPPNEIPGLTDGRTEPGSPPSGAELLHLAGLDETAQDLPDYQDVTQPPAAQEETTDEQPPSTVDQTLQGSSSGVMSALFQKFNAEVAKRLLRSITSKVYLDTIDYTWTYSD